MEKRCDVHNRALGRLEQCPDCRAEKTGAAQSGSPRADTSGARVSAARYRLNEGECWVACQARKLDDPQVAVKWSAESMKWARLATETEMKILEIEHDQWLVEQDKQRKGGS